MKGVRMKEVMRYGRIPRIMMKPFGTPEQHGNGNDDACCHY